jgi:hypothetical protein
MRRINAHSSGNTRWCVAVLPTESGGEELQNITSTNLPENIASLAPFYTILPFHIKGSAFSFKIGYLNEIRNNKRECHVLMFLS